LDHSSIAPAPQIRARWHAAVTDARFDQLKRCSTQTALRLSDTYCDDAEFSLCKRGAWYADRCIDNGDDGVVLAILESDVFVDGDSHIVVSSIEEKEHGSAEFKDMCTKYSQVLFTLETMRFTLANGVWLDEVKFHHGSKSYATRILTVDPMQVDDRGAALLDTLDNDTVPVCGAVFAVAEMYGFLQNREALHILPSGVRELPPLPRMPTPSAALLSESTSQKVVDQSNKEW
jgi:hypothetical protein